MLGHVDWVSPASFRVAQASASVGSSRVTGLLHAYRHWVAVAAALRPAGRISQNGKSAGDDDQGGATDGEQKFWARNRTSALQSIPVKGEPRDQRLSSREGARQSGGIQAVQGGEENGGGQEALAKTKGKPNYEK